MKGARGCCVALANPEGHMQGTCDHKTSSASPEVSKRVRPQCVLLLGAALGLIGCAASTPRADPQSGTRPVAATNAVVEFVAKTSAGQPMSTVGDPAVKVQVVSEYYAASGRPCKQYLLTAQNGASRSHLACGGDQGWTEVRPLILGEGSA